MDPEFDAVTKAPEAPEKLDPYALILLAQGPTRTAPVQAAIARLVGEGYLRFDEAEKRLSVGLPADERPIHPVEAAVLDAVRGQSASTSWGRVRAAARSKAVRGIEDRLRALGFVWSSRQALAMRLAPLLPLGAVLLLGLWRIDLGLERERPVGLLTLLCIALAVAAAVHLALKPWRTPRGKAVVDALRRKEDPSVQIPPEPSDSRFLLAFAVLGLAALPGTGILATLRQELLPPPSRGDGGCGGDGGDGGCGGCGGCGG